MDSLSTDDRITWRTIRKELEEIGITVAAFEANRDFIFRWLSHAIETGAFEEQHAPDSESEPLSISQSPSSDSTTYARSNEPSINTSTEVYASTELYASTEHHNSQSRSRAPPLSSAKLESLIVPTISLAVASGESSTQLKVSHLALPSSPEPSVSCERCSRSNIMYELHMRCEKCKDGNYDLCLQCWRLGRGCLNWYGFGQGAMALWDRISGSKAGESSELSFPHFLTGRRYQRVTANPLDGGDSIETSSRNGDLQLQSGFFCSNCSTFAQDTFWVYDICNDGEWGYCALCVNRGRCCAHPLLPVRVLASTDSQPSKTTQPVSQLTTTTSCNICNLPILPHVNRFHCPQCDDGDYDVCTNCYLGLVKNGQISEADGPQGWRRCFKDHRMIITGFDDSPRGHRYIIVEDLVGGHALNESHRSPVSGSYTPSEGVGFRVLALWSYWPKEDDNDELAFPKGAEIRECENINDDWFWGVYCGRKGLFPGNFGRKVFEISGDPVMRPDDRFDQEVPVAGRWHWDGKQT